MSDDSPVVKATLGERARVLELIRSRRSWKPSDISELIRWIESGAELDMPPLPLVVGLCPTCGNWARDANTPPLAAHHRDCPVVCKACGIDGGEWRGNRCQNCGEPRMELLAACQKLVTAMDAADRNWNYVGEGIYDGYEACVAAIAESYGHENPGQEIGKLERIIKQRLIEGRPVDSDVAVHAALLVSNGWPAQDALEESKRTLDDAEREGGY